MNKKDLIVTTISENYNWVDIKNWIVSLKKTSYSGDILAICYNFKEGSEYIKKLQEHNIIVLCPTNTYRGTEEKNFLWHSGYVNPQNANILIHNIRLFHLWQYFVETGDDVNYDRIIFTDGRDVVFQRNPSEWLDKNMTKDILIPSEGVLYDNEPWNKNEALTNYGPYIYEYILKNKPACNAGTFACKTSICRDFLLIKYLMVNNIGHAHQSCFNIITNTLLKDKCQWVDYKDLWALQIGAIVNELDKHSYVKDNIVYCKYKNEPYYLVHQYDRVPSMKAYYDNNL